MAAARTRKRGKGRAREGARAPLSRELIADAATELVDREGIDALSMRRLASELGIGTMTIYGYFRDKEELLSYGIERISRGYELSAGGGEWRPRLRKLIETMYRSLLEHPATVQIRSRRPILNPGAIRAGEAGMAILTEEGLEVDEAASIWRLLFTYLFGYAAFSAEEPSPEQRREWTELMGALPEDEFPIISAAAPALANWMGGREPFEAGLDLILDGIEARIEKAS